MKPKTSRRLAVVMFVAMLATLTVATVTPPVDRIQRAGGRVTVSSAGNITGTVASIAGTIKLDSKTGITTIGDVNNVGSGTKLTVDDSNGSTFVNGLGADVVNVTVGFRNNGIAQFFFVASNFTTAANTNLQAISGLTWTMPANVAMNAPFHCHLAYSQATAVVNVSFGVQDVNIAPTNIFATGHMQTNTTAFSEANLPTLTTTTATNIITATPSAITTIWNAELYGFIEQPSNASSSSITIMVRTATAGDAVTVYRGSFCRVN